MTATVAIEEGNGPTLTPTWTVITVGRYCTADLYNPQNSYPNVVPSSGFGYSYWKHTRMAISGDFTQLSDFQFYTSGGIAAAWQLGTGGMVIVGRKDSGIHGCPVASYAQATGTQGQNGTYIKDPTSGHPYYKDDTIDVINADLCTSAQPLTLDNRTITSAGATYSLVHQMKMAPDAVQGDKGNQTYTIRYKEI